MIERRENAARQNAEAMFSRATKLVRRRRASYTLHNVILYRTSRELADVLAPTYFGKVDESYFDWRLNSAADSTTSNVPPAMAPATSNSNNSPPGSQDNIGSTCKQTFGLTAARAAIKTLSWHPCMRTLFSCADPDPCTYRIQHPVVH